MIQPIFSSLEEVNLITWNKNGKKSKYINSN